jgi:hypothetical protein
VDSRSGSKVKGKNTEVIVVHFPIVITSIKPQVEILQGC